MPTPTDHDPESEAPPRRRLGRAAAIAIVLASVTTLAVVIAWMTSNPGPIHVQSIPAQQDPMSVGPTAPVVPSASTAVSSPPVAPATATPTPTATPTSTAATSTTATPRAPGPAIDSQGFVGHARCDAGDRPIAIARTERATMVVCESADGALEYQGVRLRDGASLTLDDVTPIPAGFEVRNGGTTYRLSPTELVVLSGQDLQSRDPMLEYRVQ